MKRAVLVLKNAVIPKGLDGDYYGADKGALLCLEAGKTLCGAVGDFDSVCSADRKKILAAAKTVQVLNCHKDESDTAEALRMIMDKDYDEIVVLGGLSGRFDHTWANLQLLRRYPSLIWMDEKNCLRILSPGKHTISKNGYQYISFFALKTGLISLQGVEYPLDKYRMTPLDSLGLSNEILAEEMQVSCSMDVLCVQSHD